MRALIQFGMPMWVEDEHVGYARLEVSTAEEPSQHAHEKVADEDLEELGDDDDEPPLTGSDRRSPRKSTQVRAFQAGDADDTDAAPGSEEDAEPSGSRNSSGIDVEE